jgi:acyl carrier protein
MIIKLSKKEIEDIYNALYEARSIYNETFETFKKCCEDDGIEFEKHSFDYFIKDDEHPYKPLNDKIVRDVVSIFNNNLEYQYEFTYTDEYIEEVTIDELRARFKIDDLSMCGILIDIEQKFNICLCLNDMMKLKYFRELIYIIEEKLNEER